MNCPNHPNASAIRVCVECGQHYCNACVTLKRGKVLCRNCREDKAYLDEKEEQKEVALPKDPAKAYKEYSDKIKDIKASKLQTMLKSAEMKFKSGKLCGFHPGIEAVAACVRCKKNLCESCIGFEDDKELICKECWNKIPLTARLSRKSKGRS